MVRYSTVKPLTGLANRSHQIGHSPFSSLGASMSTIESRGGCHQHVRNAVLLYQPFTLLHIPDLLIPDRPGHPSSFRRRRHLNSCKHARRQRLIKFPPLHTHKDPSPRSPPIVPLCFRQYICYLSSPFVSHSSLSVFILECNIHCYTREIDETKRHNVR